MQVHRWRDSPRCSRGSPPKSAPYARGAFPSTALSPADAIIAGDVRPGLHRPETLLRQQAAHTFALIVAVLHQQPAVCEQMIGRRAQDRANRIETLAARGQRAGGLEAQVALLKMGVAGSDVRRVGHDHVEALHAERLTPVARREFDVLDLEMSGVFARDMERRRA